MGIVEHKSLTLFLNVLGFVIIILNQKRIVKTPVLNQMIRNIGSLILSTSIFGSGVLGYIYYTTSKNLQEHE